MERQVFTTGEIAKYCGVSLRTVIRWIQRGELKAYQLPGRGDNRVELRHFLEFLNKHKIEIPQGIVQSPSLTRVLIVDDDIAMANSIRRTLAQLGLETKIACNGFQAGMYLDSFAPHIMTLDLKMPGLSGQEVLQFVRSSERFRKIKILLISGLDQNDIDQALAAGADDAITKPFSNDTLMRKVTDLIGKSAAVGKNLESTIA